MLKRGVPFTPEPIAYNKKNREYNSPLAKTPLRNVSKQKAQDNKASATLLNDDVKEKRQYRTAMADHRRQLKKIIMSPATATPKANPPTTLTPRRATPLTPSAINPIISGQIASSASQTITTEQRNKIFEEWMKIAADNKINAKNSWNVALIDYFSELTFLRDGDSINFQKASCTLDGCVKIYSTRVDAVADETGKLLNGLIDGKKDSKLATSASIDDENSRKKMIVSKKRPHKAVDTLAPNFEQLTLRNFELEFSMDPLFRKTCAEFDDSGSKGFLTSRLGFNNDGKLIFHSIDAEQIDGRSKIDETDETSIDVGNLVEIFGKELVSLGSKSIAPTLADYSFKSADVSQIDKNLLETLSRLTVMSMSTTQMEVDSDDDENLDSPDTADYPAVEIDNIKDFGLDIVPLDDGYHEAYDESSAVIPHSRVEETRTAYEAKEQIVFAPDSTEMFLTYLDSKIQKNWAGPEHWKIQRPHLRHTIASEVKLQRPAKKEFMLDFNGGFIDHSTIFQRANPATITLSKSTLDERNERDNLLPEDLHFSSTSLLQLFIKPSWTICRRSVRKSSPSNKNDSNERSDFITREFDPSYWAEVLDASPEAAERVPLQDGGYSDDNGYDEPPLLDYRPDSPTMSQAIVMGDNPIYTKRPIVENAINYSRKAKKVDVQELKKALWNEIESITSHGHQERVEEVTFTQLISDLPSTDFPKEMLSEVSVPYCFICLLHLANEHNLSLASTDNDLIVKVMEK